MIEPQLDSGRLGVSGDVRQRFLRDAIDDELLILRQRQRGLEASLDLHLRLIAERGRQGGQRALQAEILERFGTQLPRDAANVLGAAAGGFAQLVELVPQVVRDPRGQPFDLQHGAGERLADLVVQLAGDPAALALQHAQRLTRAVATLGLQPIEHLVERLRQRRDVRLPVDRHPLPGREWIVPAHRLGQLIERAEGRAQQQEIQQQHAPPGRSRAR